MTIKPEDVYDSPGIIIAPHPYNDELTVYVFHDIWFQGVGFDPLVLYNSSDGHTITLDTIIKREKEFENNGGE